MSNWRHEHSDECNANERVCQKTLLQCSRSASDKYMGITEKTGSQNEGVFQSSINGILSSGELSKSLANKQEAVGAYLASGFLDQSVYFRYPTFQALDSYRFV